MASEFVQSPHHYPQVVASLHAYCAATLHETTMYHNQTKLQQHLLEMLLHSLFSLLSLLPVPAVNFVRYKKSHYFPGHTDSPGVHMKRSYNLMPIYVLLHIFEHHPGRSWAYISTRTAVVTMGVKCVTRNVQLAVRTFHHLHMQEKSELNRITILSTQ